MTNSNQKIGVGNKQTKKYIFFRVQRYTIYLDFTISSIIRVPDIKKHTNKKDLHSCINLLIRIIGEIAWYSD